MVVGAWRGRECGSFLLYIPWSSLELSENLYGDEGDSIHDNLWNKSSLLLDYIELRDRPNQFEMFVNNIEECMF